MQYTDIPVGKTPGHIKKKDIFNTCNYYNVDLPVSVAQNGKVTTLMLIWYFMHFSFS